MKNTDLHTLLSQSYWMLFLLAISLAPQLSAQNLDWSEAPVTNPFGLNFSPQDGMAPDTSGWVKLVDMNNDGLKDLFYIRYESPYPPFPCKGACWWEVLYYQNNGTASAPDFSTSVAYPFGIPDTAYLPYAFVDIDGDQDLDIFLTQLGFEVNLTYLENTGTPEVPDFSSPLQANPFGLGPPVSDSLPEDTLDNAFYAFVDIDNDGDQDLFYHGIFLDIENFPPTPPINQADEAYYFYRNDDPTMDHTSPDFSGPFKNPFGLMPNRQKALLTATFFDMDCDGDQDMLTNFGPSAIVYNENVGSADSASFVEKKVVEGMPRPDELIIYFLGDWMDVDNDGDPDFIGNEFGVPFLFKNDVGTFPCLSTGTARQLLTDTSVEIYPNPAEDHAFINLIGGQSLGRVELSLFDQLGKKITQTHWQHYEGGPQAYVDVSGLQAGIYLIRIQTDDRFISKKLMIAY